MVFLAAGGNARADVPVVTSFVIPATSDSLTVPISEFTATDGIAVTGFLVSESDVAPQIDDGAWIPAAPIAYTFASEGSKILYAWVKDELNNISASANDSVSIIVIVADESVPVRSNGLPSGALGSNSASVNVSLVTDENATCKYSTTANTTFAAMTSSFSGAGSMAHSFVASVSSGNDYNFYVRCEDEAFNENIDDFVIIFSVASPAVIVNSVVSDPATQVVEKKKKSSSKKKSTKKKTTGSRKISNSKSKIARGTVITQRGSKFSKNSFVNLYFSKSGGGFYPPSRVKTSASGGFSIPYAVNKPAGSYSWYAVDLATGKQSKTISYSVR